MSKIADILSQLHAVAQDGSKSDRRLAALVLAEPHSISKAAISEIAQRAGVSEPTVTRFCRSLGCDGVRDFKFFLAQALAIGGQYLTAEAPTRDVREARIALAVTDGAISAIQRACDNIDMSLIINIAERIAVSSSVLCIGSGGISSMMATEMQNRLFRLGIPVVSHVDGQLQRMYAAIAGPEMTVIAFSISGYARSVIEAVEIAKQYGADTIAITTPISELAGTANMVVPFRVNEDGNLFKPTSSRFALLAIVDLIATATAETCGPEVLERLRRIKQSLNMLKVDDPSLPLGD